MDMTTLILSMLFGLIGVAFVMYAKSAGRIVPAVAGLALMICPYFISNVAVLLIVCILLTAAPFFVHG